MSLEEGDDDHAWEPSERRSKRLKTNTGPGRAVRTTNTTSRISLDPLLDIPLLPQDDFENILPKEDYLSARNKLLGDTAEPDPYNNKIRSLTVSEIYDLRKWFERTAAAGWHSGTSGEAILKRRLDLQKLNKLESGTFSYDLLRQQHNHQHRLLKLPSPLPSYSAPNEETMSALYSVRKTPYTSSFAFRLQGCRLSSRQASHLIHRDWETRTLWMDLVSDIKLHHSLSHPNDESPDEVMAPIDYVSLQSDHLPQIHELLTRIFWPGIDVSDSLRYSPTQCTVVAAYKRLVVGAAFLSSPEETYLTYLVVRPGWENANIASVMLYHLIAANPRKDIILHVSANNPAMLLYNKFGFKAEEFIVGFYEDYLAKESKACKNAFRLRLRR